MSHIVAFGDSYLDSGTLLRISEAAVAANVPQAKLLPAAPTEATYAAGRWSDGASMAEVMAQQLGVGLSNYAVGGAKATYGNYHAWLDYYMDTGLGGQIDGFEVALRGQRAEPDAIYLISAGANDYFQFHDFRQPGYVDLGESPRLSYAAVAGRAARSVSHAARRLLELGARRIVVFTAYAIECTPFAAAIEPQSTQAVSFGHGFDAALQIELARLGENAPGLQRFLVGDTMRAILADAAQYGITNTTQACQPVLPVPGPRRGDPAHYFWWDECHPSARVQALLGAALVNSVGVSP